MQRVNLDADGNDLLEFAFTCNGYEYKLKGRITSCAVASEDYDYGYDSGIFDRIIPRRPERTFTLEGVLVENIETRLVEQYRDLAPKRAQQVAKKIAKTLSTCDHMCSCTTECSPTCPALCGG